VITMTSPCLTSQQSAFLVEPGQVELRTVPVPRIQAGQVLVRIERALAGGTDRKAFVRGHPLIPMPGPFGHRYAGSVAALGSNAPRFEIGQPIMGVHSAPCLNCDLCHKKRWHLCPHVMRDKVLGAFGQYLCIPANVARQGLFERPTHLDAEAAALLEPLACVVHALEMLDFRGVDHVLILGLGALGLLFGQLLPFYTGADRTAAGRRAQRLALARRFGIDPVLDISEETLAEQLLSTDQFDVVIECTGRLDGWQEAFARTAPGGQVLFFGGLPRETIFPTDSYRLHYEEVRMLGSFHFAPRDVVKARDFLLSGELELSGLITDCVPLGQLGPAMRKLSEGQAIQYAVDPWA
jgi:L-iditol 2-dehydrogenase